MRAALHCLQRPHPLAFAVPDTSTPLLARRYLGITGAASPARGGRMVNCPGSRSIPYCYAATPLYMPFRLQINRLYVKTTRILWHPQDANEEILLPVGVLCHHYSTEDRMKNVYTAAPYRLATFH